MKVFVLAALGDWVAGAFSTESNAKLFIACHYRPGMGDPPPEDIMVLEREVDGDLNFDPIAAGFCFPIPKDEKILPPGEAAPPPRPQQTTSEPQSPK